MAQKDKNKTVNKFITAVGGLVAVLPGLSQLKKIDLLPDYWNNANLITGVATSVISFIVVLILYSYRQDFAGAPRKKIVRSTIISFCVFLTAIITYSILSSDCLIKDNQNNVAFVPIMLAPELSKKVNSPEVGGREEWVKSDGARPVREEILDSSHGELYLQLSMVIFVLLYLSLFILLILSTLVLGFHLSPEIDESTSKKDSKEGQAEKDEQKDNNNGA